MYRFVAVFSSPPTTIPASSLGFLNETTADPESPVETEKFAGWYPNAVSVADFAAPKQVTKHLKSNLWTHLKLSTTTTTHKLCRG